MTTWIWIVKRYYNGQLDDISPYYFKTYEYANDYVEMVRDKEDKSYSYSIVQIEKADRWQIDGGLIRDDEGN